jgi:hypothetical protein
MEQKNVKKIWLARELPAAPVSSGLENRNGRENWAHEIMHGGFMCGNQSVRVTPKRGLGSTSWWPMEPEAEQVLGRPRC